MENLENLLKNSLNKENCNISIPESVENKINSTFTKLEYNNSKKPYSINKIIKAIIEFLLFLFASGNIVALATNNPNIFSWVLNKLQMQNEYTQYAENVQNEIIDNETSIILKDIALDKNLLIVGYRVKFKTPIEYNKIFLEGEKRLISNPSNYNLTYNSMADMRNTQISCKLSDYEYEVYELFDINTKNLTENINFIFNISSIIYFDNASEGYFDEPIEIKSGEWNFSYTFNNINDRFTNAKKYALENATTNFGNNSNLIFPEDVHDYMETVSLIELIDSNLGTILTFDQQNYDLSTCTLEVLDSNNHILLEKNIQFLTGAKTNIIIKKLNLKDSITINFYKTDENNNVIISTTLFVNLENLIPQEDIENQNINYIDYTFKNISFTIPNSWEVNLVNNNKDVSIWLYKNKTDYDTTLGIRTIKTSESLEDVYKKFIALDTIDYAYLENDIYTFYYDADTNSYIKGEGFEYPTNIKEFTLSLEEIQKILNGHSIIKNELNITKEFIITSSRNLNIFFEEETNIGKHKAMKYISTTTYDKTQVNYIFKVNDYAYRISYDQNSFNDELIEKMINSIH